MGWGLDIGKSPRVKVGRQLERTRRTKEEREEERKNEEGGEGVRGSEVLWKEESKKMSQIMNLEELSRVVSRRASLSKQRCNTREGSEEQKQVVLGVNEKGPNLRPKVIYFSPQSPSHHSAHSRNYFIADPIMTTSTSSLDEELRKITELRKVVNTECHLVELELLRYKRQIRFSTGRIQLLYRKLRKIEKSKRTRLGMIIVEFDLRREELDWDVSA